MKKLSLDTTLRSQQDVWLTLLLDRKTVQTEHGAMLSLVVLVLSFIWQLHWKCVIDGSSWSVKDSLTNILNQRYSQLAAQFHQRMIDAESDWLIPTSTVYTERAKNHDPSFVLYHTSFAFQSDSLRYRKKLQPVVPIFVPSTPVPRTRSKYPASIFFDSL